MYWCCFQHGINCNTVCNNMEGMEYSCKYTLMIISCISLTEESLQVRKVDLLREQNGATQNTGEYENDALVIRRASTFYIDVYFGNRFFDNAKDDLTLILSVGKYRQISNHLF